MSKQYVKRTPFATAEVHPLTPLEILRNDVRAAFSGKNTITRQAAIDKAYRTYLRAAGTGFHTSRGAVWVDEEGRAWTAGSQEFTCYLAHLTGMPAGSQEFASAVAGAVRTVCFVEHATTAKLVGLSGIAQDNAICIRRNDQSLFHITDDITVVTNGQLGLLLRPIDRFEPILELPQPAPLDPNRAWRKLLSGFESQDFVSSELTLILFVTLICCILPRDLIPAVPIVAAIGPAGAGKTTLIRILANFITGHAEVELSPDANAQDSFETALSRLVLFLVDDFDEADPKFASLIRSLVTGARRIRRAKYTNDDLHELVMEARLLFATNVNPLPPTEANVSRLLPIRLVERTSMFVPEGSFEGAALFARAEFLADAFEAIRRIRPVLLSCSSGMSSQRLGGWERVVRAVAEAFPSWKAALECALAKLPKARANLLLEDDLVAEYVESLDDWEGSASQLLDQFRGADPKERNMQWDGWTSSKLAKHLQNIARSLLVARGISVTRPARTNSARLIRITREMQQ